jgi:hypothetical protein
LKSFKIPVPAADLQDSICDFLDAVHLGDAPAKWPKLPRKLESQRMQIALLGDLAAVRQLQTAAAAETEALLFSILDCASRGEL